MTQPQLFLYCFHVDPAHPSAEQYINAVAHNLVPSEGDLTQAQELVHHGDGAISIKLSDEAGFAKGQVWHELEFGVNFRLD